MKKYAPSGLSILRAFNSSSDNNMHLGLDIEVSGAISVVDASGIIINPSDNDKVVIRHNLETDGYYYYTGYFNIKKVAPHIEIIPKQLIGTSKSTDLKSIDGRPIYYHFEIRRSTLKVDSYDEYSKLKILDPQPFTQLPTKQEKTALHSYNFTN